MYIAHTSKRGEIQSLKEHLLNVEQYSGEFGSKLGLKNICSLAGMLHDVGKYSTQFQHYIEEIVQTGSSQFSNGGDHATVGGQILYRTSENKLLIAPIINAIFSHHSKLMNFEDPLSNSNKFYHRLTKENMELERIEQLFFEEIHNKHDFLACIAEAELELKRFTTRFLQFTKTQSIPFKSKLHFFNHLSVFLTKFIFSCLLDADKLDAKAFDDGEKMTISRVNWSLLQHRLNSKLESFEVKNKIDELRQKMSEQIVQTANCETAIYSLSLPTGGGKTLASLRFALEHLQQHNKKRIIYIVPFTTIIEQNVKEMNEILWRDGEKKVILEHHSNVLQDNLIENEAKIKRNEYRLPAENYVDNWNESIIFTTLVQYLNVFYNSKNRNTRRFHNLVDSIIIFDEVQAVPLESLSLFNESIKFLAGMANTTIVLCTATQPALEKISKKINPPLELVQNLGDVIEQFKRTEICYLDRPAGWNTDDIKMFIDRKMQDEDNILIIMNTKKAAKDLVLNLIGNTNFEIYHLSTSMCPQHRRDALIDIKSALREKKKKVICVSTQLIEAGVDISFNCVIRSLTGLDAIAQAAGRCNRHGEYAVKQVYVVKHSEENISQLKQIEIGGKIAHAILNDCAANNENPLGNKAMKLYFTRLYDAFDKKLDYLIGLTSIYDLFFKGKNTLGYMQYSNSIGTASEEYEVISNDSVTVIVPYKEGQEIVNKLVDHSSIFDFSQLMKDAQQYAVNLFKHEEKALEKIGAITTISFGNKGVHVLNSNSYHNLYGVAID
ncbi:CRISPR-associated helicase Cas3' [Kurthia sibirica]|uniref:CRISPR-associated helicase/endonuclease Cas3 n=1 Tax=Kurthia sibirica TaxID=202750 RepID=A0A2U3APF8_9BACL|nr:CRISPR-associated helicase Cas3' [Kurthia sibirica]PWI26433.1 CRISPR-associated helicase/endonuclease Cas3 [Kurthia sibirica]GEK32998.1 CRISPR-associated helicase/endonuclease Cas3 [Kurthia sibirica]